MVDVLNGCYTVLTDPKGPRAPLSRHREHVGYVDSYIGNRLYFNLGKGKRAFGCKGRSCRDFAETDKSSTTDDGDGGGGDDDRGDSIWTEDGSLAAAQYWGVARGGWGWGTAMFDYDNDRDLDIAMTNGFSVPGDTAYDEWTHWSVND